MNNIERGLSIKEIGLKYDPREDIVPVKVVNGDGTVYLNTNEMTRDQKQLLSSAIDSKPTEPKKTAP